MGKVIWWVAITVATILAPYLCQISVTHFEDQVGGIYQGPIS